MNGAVRDLALDAASLVALTTFLGFIALWSDFVGKVGLF